MSTDLVISRLGSALAALSEAKTIQDTKAILDVATAAEIYAKRQKMSDESIAFARDVKTEALRQLGEYIAAMPKNAGARGIGKSGVRPVNPTLAEQGIDKHISQVAQQLAALPVEKFQAVKTGKISLKTATTKPKPQPPPKVDSPPVVLSEDLELSDQDHEDELEQSDLAKKQFEADWALFYADDANKHAADQIRQLNAQVDALRTRVNGLMNELAVARAAVKRERARADKAEKALKEKF